MENNDYKFSVLMPIYIKEKAEYFRLALESIINQTLPPNEIVIVEDGSLTDELYAIIDEFKYKYDYLIKVVKLKVNSGVGIALNIGVQNCTYNIIARMDSDDISEPTRFEKQITFLKNNPNITLVGSYAIEFNKNPEEVVSYMKPPTEHYKLYKRAQFRCPLHHPTIMFLKKPVLSIGNYRNVPYMEDYEMYARLLIANYKFAVIPEFLLKTRVGNGMYKRRSGLSYFFKTEFPVQTEFLFIGFINLGQYLRNISLKFLLRCLPTPFLTLFYKTFLRDRK